ncbi:MAG: DUF1697 domain-containing protein [Candidatus Eiseniibacteriota bacterium]
MGTWVGLLRAVNVAGHNAVTMADLREFLEAAGLSQVRTVLQSGNFVASGGAREAPALERLLEREAKKRLSLETEFFVRSHRDWSALVAGNPFPAEARRDPGHLLVVFLKEVPERARVSGLENAIRGREVIRAFERHLFAYYPDGVGRSKLTAAQIARHLRGSGTVRNWNTVMRLQAMLEAKSTG